MIRSGAEMNAPSMTFASTRDLVSTFSRFQMPRRVCISHREVRTLLARGLRVAGGRIAHGQRDVTRGHVLAGADAEAGLSLVEEVACRLALLGLHRLVAVVAPAVALAGVQGHAVTRSDL